MSNRPTISSLITEDLHYCCLFFFFSHYRNAGLISARLGIHPRTVQQFKARFRNGEFKCEKKRACLHARITLSGDLRKLPYVGDA